jgi:protein-disulfide isomerase
MKTETKVIAITSIISLIILIGGGIYYSKNMAPAAVDLDKNNPALVGNRDNVKKATGEEKVVLVEFGDFECPACAASAVYVNDLVNKYKENVTFVWRTYPIHQNSVIASRAAFAAKEVSNDPDMFFKMGDLLFEKQDEWFTASGARNQVELFTSYAGSLGLDQNKFREILNSNKYEDIIAQDNRDAMTLGTRVTPTFYVNGKIVEGGRINDIEAIILEEINK